MLYRESALCAVRSEGIVARILSMVMKGAFADCGDWSNPDVMDGIMRVPSLATPVRAVRCLSRLDFFMFLFQLAVRVTRPIPFPSVHGITNRLLAAGVACSFLRFAFSFLRL